MQASIRELKAHLSEYIRQVTAGEKPDTFTGLTQ